MMRISGVIREGLNARQSGCIFCDLPADRVVHQMRSLSQSATITPSHYCILS